VANDLRRAGEGQSSGGLSPNGKRRDKIADVVKEEVPLWVIGVTAAAVGFVFFLVMNFLISGTANDVVKILGRGA